MADSKLKLLSLHIPKTAGTSFFSTLEEVYGYQNVVRFDIKPHINKVLLNNELYTQPQLPKSYTVLHGHMPLDELYFTFPQANQYPIITWLRHPVERVISNYYYLENRLQHFIKDYTQHRAILDKMMRTLEEFASAEINRNKITKFIGQRDPEHFAFIGFVESYEKDLSLLSQHLQCKMQSFTHNQTERQFQQIPERIRRHIAALNEEDIAYYEMAKEYRSKIASL